MDRALGVQPTGSDSTPGAIALRIANTTGNTIDTLGITYDIYVRNDQNRSSSFDLFFSVGDESSYSVSLTFASDETADATPTWNGNTQSTTLTSLGWAAGAFMFLEWRSVDFSGSGSRDELALDNININSQAAGIAEPATLALLGLGLAGLGRRRSR